MSNSGDVWVVIPAAGIGKRMQSDIPKQYLKINDKTILEHTLNCFSQNIDIEGIIVALNSEDVYWDPSIIDVTDKKLYTVDGGEERSDSVLNALEYLSVIEQLPDETWVMVHDAARPCLLTKDIDALLEIRLQDTIGGILATPVRDTMKRAQKAENITANNNGSDSEISHSENRENLWHALTPQLFRLGALREALKSCLEKDIEVTDEASALEAQGMHPLLVEGNSNNIKITQAADLELATWFLNKG